MVAAILFTFLLQLAVIYLPWANDIFKTQPLSPAELAICIGLAAVIFHAVELEKWIRRRRFKARKRHR
jgi:P-type Ca2+ transporter type 2C